MTTLIIDGVIASHAQIFVDNMLGASIFTTLRVDDGQPQLWPLHWQRLCGHAQYFGYNIPPEHELVNAIELYAPKPCAKVRIIINQTSWAQTLDPYQPPSASVYDGVSIIFSKLRPHPQLGAYKTTSYLPYSLAHKEALERGAFEALLCNDEGYVVDGSRTSLLLYDGVVMTALLGGLEGCMRQSIMAYAEQQGITTCKQFLRPHELHGQLVLSNSLMGAVPVGPARYPLIRQITEHFHP